MDEVKIHIKRLRKDRPVFFPRYMTDGASGMDLFAALDNDVTLQPGERRLIPTGISLAIPEGFEGQVRARSGLAIRNGIGVVNGPGTIDADYRGEVGIILINHGREAFVFKQGDRIAQIGVYRVEMAAAVEVEVLEATARGAGGFGHTGR